MAPGSIHDIFVNILRRGDILSREHFSHIHKLAIERVTSKTNSLRDRLQIRLVVAATGIEVVEDDVRHIEGIGRAQRHRSGGVARVSLENRPGEPVVALGDVDAVIGEVAAEVDRPAEDECIVAIIRGY